MKPVTHHFSKQLKVSRKNLQRFDAKLLLFLSTCYIYDYFYCDADKIVRWRQKIQKHAKSTNRSLPSSLRVFANFFPHESLFSTKGRVFVLENLVLLEGTERLQYLWCEFTFFVVLICVVVSQKIRLVTLEQIWSFGNLCSSRANIETLGQKVDVVWDVCLKRACCRVLLKLCFCFLHSATRIFAL